VVFALVGALLALAPVAASAGDIEVTARVDRTTATVNDQIRLTVTVTGTIRSVPTPELPDLTADFNTFSAGTSTNLSIVNGAITSSKSWNYSLQPRSEGVFTIPPIEVDFDGAVYSSEPIEIEVLPGAAPPPAGSQERRESSGISSDGRSVFITTSVDRKRAYVGEQITLSFKFYRRINLWRQPRYGAPDLTGFWVEDLPPQDEYVEIVDGIQYQVIEIKTALFGAAAGTATIGEATISYEDRADPFSIFSMPGRERILRTDPIEVEIVPLPADGRPAGFGGAVGEYEITATADTRRPAALEAVTVKVTIEGSGNVRTVPAPSFQESPEFKVYESGSATDVTRRGRIVGGRRTHSFVFVPQSEGSRGIPAFELSYFDPATREYRTTRTRPIVLEVGPPAAGAAAEATTAPTSISRLGRDIRYIREPEGRLRPAARPLAERPWFLFGQILPAAALAAVWATKRRRDRYSADEALARYARASSRARRALRSARETARAGDRAGTCSAVASALVDFVGDRLNVGARGMTVAELAATLRAAGADDDTIARVRSILAQCDAGRFSGGGDGVETERLLRDGEACLSAIERISRRRGR